MTLEKLSPPDSPISCGFNPLRQFPGRRRGTANDEPQFVVAAQTELPLERTYVGDTISKVHAKTLTPFRGSASGFWVGPVFPGKPQNWRMSDIDEKWVQHPAWRKDLEAYQERTGRTQQQIADDLGISVFTVRNHITGSKPIGIRRRVAYAELFGVDPARYLDLPSPADSALSEVARFQLAQAHDILSDPRFSDTDRQELVNELKARATWMLNIKGGEMRYWRYFILGGIVVYAVIPSEHSRIALAALIGLGVFWVMRVEDHLSHMAYANDKSK